MKKPKILVNAQFPFDMLDGVTGGRGAGQISTWLPQLAMSWKQQEEFDIHWCVLGHKQPTRRIEKRWGQTFHLLPSPSITASMLLNRIPQKRIFRRLIDEFKPKLVHCWGTENLYGTCLQAFSGPSILSMQGIVSSYFQTGDLKGWRWKLFKHWEKPSICRASLVTSESKWGLEQVAKIVPGKNLSKVEYGVHPSFYETAWDPNPEHPRILFVGNLRKLKGVDILIDSLRRNPLRKWTMVFVGDGYLTDDIRSLKDPKIDVLGSLKTKEVQAEMSKAWALVMPSRADTSPNVVKEARVIGLPVIGSIHGGHAEYILDKKDGYIIQSEDSQEWYNAMNQLGNNLGLCREMGTYRHAWFREYFQPDNTAKEFLHIYRELAS